MLLRWTEIIGAGKDAFDVYSIGGIFAAIGLLVLIFVIAPIFHKYGPQVAEKYPALGTLFALLVLAFAIYIVVSNFPGW